MGVIWMKMSLCRFVEFMSLGDANEWCGGVDVQLHLAGRDGGKLEDGLLPMANPDANEPTGWILDSCDDRLEEYAPGWFTVKAAATGTSVLRPISGEGLLESKLE